MNSIIIKNIVTNSSVRFARNSCSTRCFSASSSLGSKKPPEEAIPKNIIEKYYGHHLQPKGDIYDKQPFKLTLTANKKYAWCSCGHSKTQPLCDGTHKLQNLRIRNLPIYFKVEETKEYWLCNCKQSEHRPFCDGTHTEQKIQEALKYHKF